MFEDARMLFHLFPEAIAAGLIISCVCALLGVFVILKRVVFIGIVLSEVAACGIAAAMVCHVHPFVGACILTLATVALLSQPFETNRIPRDAVLGIIFVLASALSILLVSKSGFGLQEVKALLYGDLILTSSTDFVIVLVTLLPVIICFIVFFRPTLYTFLDREGARVLGIRVAAWELLYFFALGLAVSAASRVAGALLIFCYLVVAPSAALLVSRRLWIVIAVAVLVAVISTVFGLCLSIRCDLPANQTVAVTACGFSAVAFLVGVLRWFLSKYAPAGRRPARRP